MLITLLPTYNTHVRCLLVVYVAAGGRIQAEGDGGLREGRRGHITIVTVLLYDCYIIILRVQTYSYIVLIILL